MKQITEAIEPKNSHALGQPNASTGLCLDLKPQMDNAISMIVSIEPFQG